MASIEWLAMGWSPPERGKWGWLGDGTFVEPPLGFRTHNRNADVGYHDRRVKSIPRIKGLAKGPYRFRKEDLVKANFYLGLYYPSGQASYAASMGWVTEA